ncbi:hypothetical protein [Pontibacter pamirensis]|uniref:hypothetical protein n=1 Tax=Pontibacter pamirensis TaxID=2562824 RepID=UPI0013895F46|nr:hypothetical protein [Pontibacter pamirensis]
MGKTIHKIEHREEIGIVEAVWYSTASQQDLKQALSFGLLVHEQTHCSYRLDDITKLSGLWADSVAWLEKDWLPCACRAGVRYVAFVASLSSSGEVAGTAHPMDSIGSLTEVRFFTDGESALNWLKNKQTGGL